MKSKQVAVIREAECIGCTKCIQACPVDAILGSRKAMHTVIEDECIGCELCIAPCPVDCIDLISLPAVTLVVAEQKTERGKQRFQARKKRLATMTVDIKTTSPSERKAFIQAALLRAKNK